MDALKSSGAYVFPKQKKLVGKYSFQKFLFTNI